MAPSTALYPSNGVKSTSLNVSLRPRVALNTQVWIPVKNGIGRSHLLTKALFLVPEESAGQRLWERQDRWADIRKISSKTRGNYLIDFRQAIFTHPYDLKSVSLGDSYPRMTTSINLNPCIITFYLIVVQPLKCLTNSKSKLFLIIILIRYFFCL